MNNINYNYNPIPLAETGHEEPPRSARECNLLGIVQNSLASCASWVTWPCKALSEIIEKQFIQRRLANLFIKNNMPSEERQIMEDAIAAIPIKKQKDILEKATLLIDSISLSSYEIKPLFNMLNLNNFPKDDWIDVIEKTAFFLDGRTKSSYMTDEITTLLRVMLNTPIQDRLKHLERIEERLLDIFPIGLLIDHYNIDFLITKQLSIPLDQPLPGRLGRMAAAAARGKRHINVHDGQRDVLTTKALKLLREHQADMINLEEALEAAEDCIAYLKKEKDKTEDVQLKQKLEIALLALEAPIKQGGQDWGPLLTEPSQDPNESNLYLVGKEVLGRLWLYIQTIPDQADGENAIASLISALNSSTRSADGSRVCNPGKIERLFIAILQGRLEGVVIDDSIDLGEKPSSKTLTSQSLARFFSDEAHQKIDNRKDLLQAGRLFCRNNPTVNRMGFLRLLDEYMALEPETFGAVI